MMIEHCDKCRIEIPKEKYVKGKFDAIFFKKKNNDILFYSLCRDCLMELEKWLIPASRIESEEGEK